MRLFRTKPAIRLDQNDILLGVIVEFKGEYKGERERENVVSVL